MPKHGAAKGFPERLRRLRERLGMSQNEFAAAAGVQAQSIRNWEERGSAPGAATLANAMRNLGMTEWQRTAIWLVDPDSDPPSWLDGLGPVPRLDRTRPNFVMVARDPGIRTARSFLPRSALEQLLKLCTEAEARADFQQVATLEDALIDIVVSCAGLRWERISGVGGYVTGPADLTAAETGADPSDPKSSKALPGAPTEQT